MLCGKDSSRVAGGLATGIQIEIGNVSQLCGVHVLQLLHDLYVCSSKKKIPPEGTIQLRLRRPIQTKRAKRDSTVIGQLQKICHVSAFAQNWDGRGTQGQLRHLCRGPVGSPSRADGEEQEERDGGWQHCRFFFYLIWYKFLNNCILVTKLDEDTIMLNKNKPVECNIKYSKHVYNS